jgi:hypothetical protein
VSASNGPVCPRGRNETAGRPLCGLIYEVLSPPRWHSEVRHGCHRMGQGYHVFRRGDRKDRGLRLYMVDKHIRHVAESWVSCGPSDRGRSSRVWAAVG